MFTYSTYIYAYVAEREKFARKKFMELSGH